MLVSCIVLLSSLANLRSSLIEIAKPKILNCVYNTEKKTVWINSTWNFKSGYSNRVTVNQSLNPDCSVKDYAVYVDDRSGIPNTIDRIHFTMFSRFLIRKLDVFSKNLCLISD